MTTLKSHTRPPTARATSVHRVGAEGEGAPAVDSFMPWRSRSALDSATWRISHACSLLVMKDAQASGPEGRQTRMRSPTSTDGMPSTMNSHCHGSSAPPSRDRYSTSAPKGPLKMLRNSWIELIMLSAKPMFRSP